ncbi:hypothetical protein HELRODRAFT_75748 [Helobdella robusta]|uniref:Golgi to ER traffic protein 4 homolog n=1 Tax=Helobdella robusta TaxID=6412 RepID=T1G296_HELRO|nr:hypothetical protein HELRODRAFT_75748 [Helobdella robusta]ESO07612.1 hypothetical protein HELRODRAFT_75748 [Helobdella robusta]
MAATDEKAGKIKNSIQTKLNNCEFYEAHQLYKVLFFRYSSQKKNKEALDLTYDGSLALFNAQQMSSGVDLALIFVDFLEKSNATPDSENIARVSKLHSLIAMDHVERQKFVGLALHWVHKCSHALLHGEFGINYWHEKDYIQARYHLVRSHKGEACASMLIEYHVTCGYPNEVDLFIVQAVLQILCLTNKQIAATCFNRYTSKHPQVEAGPPYIKPLLNFLWMLLIAIDKGSLSIFTVLCEQYDLSLKRDPSYHDYLARIAHIFFNVSPPKKNNYGIFG